MRSAICTHTDRIRLTALHASSHARSAQHLIGRSAEPGEDWSWCYLDNVAFVVTRS